MIIDYKGQRIFAFSDTHGMYRWPEVPVDADILTDTGLGMKSPRTRNFEAGIFTDFPTLVSAAINKFDSVWAGLQCKDCGRKKFCGDPIR